MLLFLRDSYLLHVIDGNLPKVKRLPIRQPEVNDFGQNVSRYIISVGHTYTDIYIYIYIHITPPLWLPVEQGQCIGWLWYAQIYMVLTRFICIGVFSILGRLHKRFTESELVHAFGLNRSLLHIINNTTMPLISSMVWVFTSLSEHSSLRNSLWRAELVWYKIFLRL